MNVNKITVDNIKEVVGKISDHFKMLPDENIGQYNERVKSSELLRHIHDIEWCIKNNNTQDYKVG